MHRPRGAGAVLTPPAPDGQRPLPQPWVPRVVNAGLGIFFLVVLAPVVTSFEDKRGYIQVALVVYSVPFLLVAGLCLTSALRPGSIGRAARRLRGRRR